MAINDLLARGFNPEKAARILAEIAAGGSVLTNPLVFSTTSTSGQFLGASLNSGSAAFDARLDIGSGASASTSQGAFFRIYQAANATSQGGIDTFVKTGGNFRLRNDTSVYQTFNSTTGTIQIENIAGLTAGDFSCAKIGGSLSITQGTGAFKGDVTLTAGVGTVTGITNIASNHGVFLGNLTPGGTGGTRYKIVITAGTGFTVTAVDTAGATVTTDTSTFKYVIIK
jgi:hypothetical protein